MLHREQREKAAAAGEGGGLTAGGHMQIPASLQRAQQVARDILNLSQSDLEDFISPAESDHSTLSVRVQ